MDMNRTHRTLAAWELFLTGGRADPLDPVAFFRHVAESVPGYQKFLDEHGIDPASVITAADFDTLPLLTKDTYHRRYRLADICRD
jgi:phenylacetate-CoA ligase